MAKPRGLRSARDAGERASRLVCAALVALAPGLPAPAVAAGERTVRLDPSACEIRFTVGTTARTVEGSFRLREGEVRFDPEIGRVSGRIVVDAATGDAGSKLRTRNMHVKVLESERFPDIVFLPERLEGALPAAGEGTITVHGTLEIHGEGHPLSVELTIRADGKRLSARGGFRVPYVEWGMSDPSVFVHRVEKHVDVAFEMRGSLED